MTNEERDEYIKKTHDTVLTLVADVKNHVSNNVIHQIPPCETARKIEERTWKTTLALFMASLGCIGSLIMLIISWIK